MRGPRPIFFMLLGTGVLVAACERDKDSGVLTAPSFAPAAGQCNGSTISRAVRATFTDNTTRQNIQTIAQDMVTAFGNGEIGKATWFGFQIMNAVDTAGRTQGGVQPSSDLTVSLFPCMALGAGSRPTTVVTELESGAYGVRGRSSTDVDAVIAQGGTWILEPPQNKTWHQITTLQSRAGITGDTAEVFLALGKPQSGANFTAEGDLLLAGTFNWSTMPTAAFGDPYVVVGQCEVGGGFLQHNPATSSNAEIFGFVQPVQCPEIGFVLEPAPRSLSERLVRAFTPAPAYAAALRTAGSGGGTKPSLSPFGIMNPGKVNLSKFTQSPSKSGNIINRPLTPTPILKPKSNGGVPFKQASVLVYLATFNNNGTPSQICYNWAYNDDQGTVDFPHSFITKAGGSLLFGTSVGTRATPEETEQPVPLLEAGLTATSTSFNLKNDGSSVSLCPVFDGTKYFSNILDPAADVFTFDPEDASTFPPNYDVEEFPEP